MKPIELRSDTFTQPTRDMLESILSSELGDDVEREDPTVNRLQDLATAMFRAEDALLVPSGTMGNLVSMLTHCTRGDEIVLESEAHIYYYELGGISALVGAVPRLIPGVHGVFTEGQLEENIREPDPLHYPRPKLVAIENTHNRAGGCCWTPEQVGRVARVAHDHGLKVHIDGARIFNACVALDRSPMDYMRHVDSITFCLSKGLCCPIGSIILGGKEFIEQARINRKMVGGGLRQSGVIAAPGIYALNNMIGRLHEDHRNARLLAEGLRAAGINVDMDSVQTNIVIADIREIGINENVFVAECKRSGVLLFTMGPGKVRFVTHHGIHAEDIAEAIARISETVRRLKAKKAG